LTPGNHIGQTEWENLSDEEFTAFVEALRKTGELTKELKRKINEEEKWRKMRRSRHNRDLVPPKPDDKDDEEPAEEEGTDDAQKDEGGPNQYGIDPDGPFGPMPDPCAGMGPLCRGM
jgi:hypothetical protein